MNKPGLRSLDAIRLATARIPGPDLEAVVSYDDSLVRASAMLAEQPLATR